MAQRRAQIVRNYQSLAHALQDQVEPPGLRFHTMSGAGEFCRLAREFPGLSGQPLLRLFDFAESVFVPNQRITRPCESSTDMTRVRNGRKLPSAARKTLVFPVVGQLTHCHFPA